VPDLSIPVAEPSTDDNQFALGDLDLALPEIPPSTGNLMEDGGDPLQQALSSIDFQLDFGSLDEAMMEVDRALSIYQDDPELLMRRQSIEEKLNKKKAAKTSIIEQTQETSSFDLSDILDLSLGASQNSTEMHDNTNAAAKIQTAEELFNAFRDEIADKVSHDDYDTQYNLGIAYKEMMLADPAIESFKKAMADPERTLECCSMLALCEEIRGDMDAAAQWLKKGIDDPGFPPIDSIGLRRDFANLLNRMGRHEEANIQTQEVQKLDQGFDSNTE
jgi:tetratricopeptide (TPR) repeat protein